MGAKVTVKYKSSDTIKKVEKAREHAMPIYTREVLKDIQPYVPKDTGALERSALNNSRFDEGLMIWSTPYARKLYYNPTGIIFNKGINSKATMMWGEKSKADNMKKWEKLYKTLFSNNFK